MTTFQTSDVVFDQATQPHYFNRMRAERVLVMITQSHQQKDAGQKNDDYDADRCSGEQFEMKMPLTKKPIAEPAEDRPAPFHWLRWQGGVDRRIYHNCV